MPKILLIFLLLFGSYLSFSQQNPKRQNSTGVTNVLNTLIHDTCLDKQFSIVFYVVLDSTYSVVNATPQTLKDIIDTLNVKFKPICVSFVNCSTVYIPNFHYNRWYKASTDAIVTSNWYTDNTINFFIVDSIKDAPTYERGYAYPPPVTPTSTKKDVVVVEQFRGSPPFNNTGFYHVIHAMGHFFGLVHTYDELNIGLPATPPPPGPGLTYEYADGSNSSIHGDTLNDTAADPGPQNFNLDGKGERYIRPIENYMSFISAACKFSQKQYNLMAWMIYRRRLYLH